MPGAKKLGTIIFVVIIIFFVSLFLLTIMREAPTLAVSVRSFSMEPVMTRGDLVTILPMRDEESLSEGDIIMFRSEEAGIHDWTMHRIVGGDHEEGFITQGDNNERTDQEGGTGYPPIKPEWIGGVVPTVGEIPLKIPLVGYIPLLIGENLDNPLLLPIFLGCLALILLIDELTKSNKERKKDKIQTAQLYYLAGLAFAIFMGAFMLMGSLLATFPYVVEKEEKEVVMQGDISVIEKGETKEVTIAEIERKGFIPVYYYLDTNDSQINFKETEILLDRGETREIKANVHALSEGEHVANVTVGMFLPFLPFSVIRILASLNYWLALIVVSSVPAIPLFLLPFFDQKYKRRFMKTWRKKLAFINYFT